MNFKIFICLYCLFNVSNWFTKVVGDGLQRRCSVFISVGQIRICVEKGKNRIFFVTRVLLVSLLHFILSSSKRFGTGEAVPFTLHQFTSQTYTNSWFIWPVRVNLVISVLSIIKGCLFVQMSVPAACHCFCHSPFVLFVTCTMKTATIIDLHVSVGSLSICKIQRLRKRSNFCLFSVFCTGMLCGNNICSF